MTEPIDQPIPIRIWVDADACPSAIKDILFRTARRLNVELTLVANQSMRAPKSELIRVIAVPHGADVADNTIVEMMNPGDVVITGDIPLAARVVEKQGVAIGTRGELFDEATVHARLASRNLMDHLAPRELKRQVPNRKIKKTYRHSPISWTEH